MALQIMKIKVLVDGDVTLAPTVSRFFHTIEETAQLDAPLTIGVEDFFDNTGAAATEFPALTADNSYVNVYINGVMQMGNLVTYTPGAAGTGSLTIAVPEDGPTEIVEDTPIVIEVVNFAPDITNTTITT